MLWVKQLLSQVEHAITRIGLFWWIPDVRRQHKSESIHIHKKVCLPLVHCVNWRATCYVYGIDNDRDF